MAVEELEAPQPTVIYQGRYGSNDVRLLIGNGGAGQSGLVGVLANRFIDYLVQSTKCEPFAVGWVLGDTTETLKNISLGWIDVGITYNVVAEQESIQNGDSIRSVYGFRDHFLLVGPPENPADLDPSRDSLNTMFSKIIEAGEDINAPLPTRFLSRFDKSATNIKESELFVNLGHVPWALPYSIWYHQYPRFPAQALAAACTLKEYTLTDRGTFLSASQDVQAGVVIYKAGGDDDPADPLLNPGHVLLGRKAQFPDIAAAFMDWMADPDYGQYVVETFCIDGKELYSPAPPSDVV